MLEEIKKYLLPVLKAKERSILSGKEVILKGITPLSILLKISQKELVEQLPAFAWRQFESIFLFYPPFLTEGIIQIGHKKVSLIYSIPEDVLVTKLFDKSFSEMNMKRLSWAYLVINIELMLTVIYAIIGNLLGWECRNFYTIKEISDSSIKISIYDVPDKDLAKVTNSILKEAAEKPLSRLKKINERDLKEYLREIHFIDKNDRPLVPYFEIRDVLEKYYTEGLTLRNCLYCDEKFFAKGKGQYDNPSCKVSHFQKKKLIGKEALLEDGMKVKIKDIKKYYTVIEYPDKRGVKKAATKKQWLEGTADWTADLPLIVHIRR